MRTRTARSTAVSRSAWLDLAPAYRRCYSARHQSGGELPTPDLEFNKILIIEKEGFSEALRKRGWDKRHDCMVLSSKGFTTRALKDLVDKLADHDEPVTVFSAHDADASGTMINQTLQEATAARGARR